MALIPPFFLDCVVAIGANTPNGPAWNGTGFIVGRATGEINENGDKSFHTFLVTNKHVLENKQLILLRFDTQQGSQAKDYNVDLEQNGKKIWVCHQSPDVDIAVFQINPKILENDSARFAFFSLDDHVMTITDMNQNGVSEGDSIFVLGFPLGIVSAQSKHVISKSGSIARIRDVLAGQQSCFLIDANIFPGNSGGPVINRPELSFIQGTKAINKSSLIGIVKSYVTYQDVAVSQQTGRPRVIFEENSGLALVETVDNIKVVIDICRQQNTPSP